MKKIYFLFLLISSIGFSQNPGDIIITEVMQNPNAVGDTSGEYFELYNTTGATIDLLNWVIKDDVTASETHTIGSSVVVPSGGYVVLGVNADTGTNGGVTVDYVYTTLNLGNSTDGIIVESPTAVMIDQVIWDNGATFPDPNGASMNLNPANLNATDNDTGANWCESTSAIGGGDLGTPGSANDACGATCALVLGAHTATCDAVTVGVDTYTVDLSFIGGGTSTYVINTTSGTIGGDDPSLVASGTIQITGVNEGTDITITVDDSGVGGVCNLTRDVTSPICLPVSCPSVGDIVITEIMQNPNAVSDNAGEWFEVYNTTGGDIDMQGWVLNDSNSGSETHTIATSLIVPAGGYIVLGNNTDVGTNGGVTVDYNYGSSYFLGNGADDILLDCSGTSIDVVAWDGGPNFPDPTGASMTLNPSNLNATDNDTGSNWCTATTAYGLGDLGTPGTANDTCGPTCSLVLTTHTATCDAVTTGVDTYTVNLNFTGGATSTYMVSTTSGVVGGDNPSSVAAGTITITGVNEGTDITITVDDSGVGGVCNLTRDVTSPVCFPAVCPSVGDVVITEIMQNPNAVSDNAGEWFELYNTTGSPVDLQGWVLNDSDSSETHTIATSLIIPAGGYIVLGNNADTLTNGGVTIDYEYGGSYFLGNGADDILLDCSGTTIDVVAWDGGPNFPDPTGASMNLNPTALDATSNDTGSNWCEATMTYGAGDLGTPGVANTTCAPTAVLISPAAYLQGPLLLSGTAIMDDSLRAGGYIPTTSPYSDALTTTAPVLAVTGNDAIIDWVLIELRDETNNAIVSGSSSALLQADGDIVGTDGTSTLSINVAPGNYYVAVRHQNHLSVMTNAVVALSGTTTSVDFRDGVLATFGSNAQTTYGIQAGLSAMWAGNANDGGNVRFAGASNDANQVKDYILAAPGNILSLLTYNFTGYHLEDVNLNGAARFAGADNDANVIKDNVLNHPGNILSLITYTITDTLP